MSSQVRSGAGRAQSSTFEYFDLKSYPTDNPCWHRASQAAQMRFFSSAIPMADSKKLRALCVELGVALQRLAVDHRKSLKRWCDREERPFAPPTNCRLNPLYHLSYFSDKA